MRRLDRKSLESAHTGVHKSVAGSAWFYGLVHALVDAASALSVYRAGGDLVLHLEPFTLIVLYDALAFGLQAPLGLIFDKWRAYQWALISGLALSLLALVFARVSPFSTAICVGVGNALFHLGAGAVVLRDSQGRASDAGVFVAPGAVGLALGIGLGRMRNPTWWPIAGALTLALLAVMFTTVRKHRRSNVIADSNAPVSHKEALAPVIMGTVLILLLGSVYVRSFVGFGACYRCPRIPLLVLGVPTAAFLGKLVGGFLADRVGWQATGVGVLLASAPLVAFNGGSIGMALLGLLLFQMTMPVTLAAVYRIIPNRPGLAFGLPCLALLGGALPTFYPAGKLLYSGTLFVVLVMASALALRVALRKIGQSAVSLEQMSGAR